MGKRTTVCHRICPPLLFPSPQLSFQTSPDSGLGVPSLECKVPIRTTLPSAQPRNIRATCQSTLDTSRVLPPPGLACSSKPAAPPPLPSMVNTMASDALEAQVATPAIEKTTSSQLETANGAITVDEETNKRLLKRIDRRVMPVVSKYCSLASNFVLSNWYLECH